ncbi:MAG: hypothetical protein A2Z38_07925 [Planctomycetes bacterium RBG_19FT_COMBO_48_8]|nr:MAG: hypothetical protein A2Z38_07925 [Planctomycetes bacterium RBG_19FT_COMBO_48_8]
MRLRDIIIWFSCIALAIGLLIAAGMQLDPINRQRQDMGLIIDTPENMPPSLAFATIATGAFRGLVVDVLWMRADKLKDEGQFFDARQLAEWITILQPRFASVWEFHAWNMAYNISVAIPATQPDQRWRWVRNGYELLRDEAIDKYKLKNISLYRELARIFQHKIGGVSDDAHKYYKLQLAMSMEPLLRSEDNQLGPQDNRYFDALAEAPVSWQEIVTDPNVASLVKALKSADNTFSDDDEFVNNYLSLRQNSGRFNAAAGKTIDDIRGSDALKKFDLFAKARQLRKIWKLDPVLMSYLNRTYGPIDFTDPNTHLPLDWRLSDSHAIYWGVKGLQITAREQSREIDIIETNTDRIVGHSLQNLFRNGKLFIRDMPIQVPVEGSQETQTQIFKEVFLRPDLRMFDTYNKSFLAVLDKYKDDKEGTLISLQNGHRNMLKNAVLSFYQSGHKLKAQKIYDQLRKLYDFPEFKVPMEEFARKRFVEELESIGLNDANEQVVLLLRESFYLYAIGDDEASYGREALAKEIHDYYQKKYLDENRIDLPDFKVLQYLALRDFLEDWQYVPNLRLSLLARIEIERPELYEKLKPWKEDLEQQRDKVRQQEQELIKSF